MLGDFSSEPGGLDLATSLANGNTFAPEIGTLSGLNGYIDKKGKKLFLILGKPDNATNNIDSKY